MLPGVAEFSARRQSACFFEMRHPSEATSSGRTSPSSVSTGRPRRTETECLITALAEASTGTAERPLSVWKPSSPDCSSDEVPGFAELWAIHQVGAGTRCLWANGAPPDSWRGGRDTFSGIASMPGLAVSMVVGRRIAWILRGNRQRSTVNLGRDRTRTTHSWCSWQASPMTDTPAVGELKARWLEAEAAYKSTVDHYFTADDPYREPDGEERRSPHRQPHHDDPTAHRGRSSHRTPTPGPWSKVGTTVAPPIRPLGS